MLGSYVRPTIERIFRHRRVVIARLLGEDTSAEREVAGHSG